MNFMRLVFIFAALFASNAFAGGVKLLATVKVGQKLAAYRVPLQACGNNLTAIKLRVSGANVVVQDFGVRFTDGSEKSFPVNKGFAGGSESDWIDLANFRAMDPRCVASVIATVRTEGGPASRVDVFGNLK